MCRRWITSLTHSGSTLVLGTNGDVAAGVVSLEGVHGLKPIALSYKTSKFDLFSASSPFNATKFSTDFSIDSWKFLQGLKVVVESQKVGVSFSDYRCNILDREA